MTARLAHVKAPGDRFRCEPYRGAMTGENCIRRQAMARAGDERFGKCRRCKDGLRVARQVTGRAVKWTPCAAEGCRLAASPIHESGLCLTHARERKAKEETMTDLCERPGCVRPRAKSPGTIEGGEGLCREHRGALARAAKKAAEAKAPAPLTVPDPTSIAMIPDITDDVAAAIAAECDAIKAMLLEKNRAYGNSAFAPVRIFSTSDTVEQIRVRIDDKLSRLARGNAAGEDVTADLIGYLVLLRVAQKRRAGGAS